MASSTSVVLAGSARESAIAHKRELIVIVDPKVAMRTSPSGVSGVAVADTLLKAISGTVKASNSEIHPLFADIQGRHFASPPGAPQPRLSTPNLSRFFKVRAEDQQLEDIAHSLKQIDYVRGAYIKPPTALAALNTMTPRAPSPSRKTPDFTARQKYLDPAPGGIDARYAWTLPGGTGKDVKIIDIEGEWRFSHEDLLQNKGGVVGGVPPNDLAWRNHGTAVIAEFGADDNGIGIKGICPDAEVSGVSIFPTDTMGSSVAIRLATQRLRPGDIILIELHRPGPRHGFVDRDDQQGYIPIEWWPDDFAVIQFAISRGIVVVEAGGNGGEDLDDSLYDTPQDGFPNEWKNPFKRSNRDSGAIVVGAGAPPPGTHRTNHGPDRSRLDFSNFGSIVDAQGWGREVTTCGYGDLQGGASEDIWYTDQFSGTSSASPIVVGAIGCLQGILRARKAQPSTPAEIRQLLRTTGSPQTSAPQRPASQRIGNRPDLRQLIRPASKPPSRASVAKGGAASRTSGRRSQPRGKG